MNASKPPLEGYASFGVHQTWYRVTGDLHSGLTPLVILHGGPGCTHDTLDAFRDVAASGRAIVQFDHLGSGLSTRLDGKPPSFWSLELYLEQLDNLLDHLRISQDYALLGHSWGAALASEHGVRAPAGLRALILANAPADMRTWEAETLKLRTALPEEALQVLAWHEQPGSPRGAEYVQAWQLYFERHVCRCARGLKRWRGCLPRAVVPMARSGGRFSADGQPAGLEHRRAPGTHRGADAFDLWPLR